MHVHAHPRMQAHTIVVVVVVVAAAVIWVPYPHRSRESCESREVRASRDGEYLLVILPRWTSAKDVTSWPSILRSAKGARAPG